MRRIASLKYTLENGKMQVVEDDVLNIVRRVSEISSRLTVYWNDHIEEFTITETSIDGAEERLVFNVPELDERVLHRLLVADTWHGNDVPSHVVPETEDFLTRLEHEEDLIDKQKLERQRGVMSEIIAPMASYMDLDGRGTKASILIPKGVNRGEDDAG